MENAFEKQVEKELKSMDQRLYDLEEFKKRFSWTIGIIVCVGLIIQYLSSVYRNIK